MGPDRTTDMQTLPNSFDDIQTAPKPLQKSEKNEINFYNHFKTN